MLNFRKLKQDFSSNILQDGRKLYENDMVVSAKIVSMGKNSLKITASIIGNFDNKYECELEVGRLNSEIIDSNCDCPYTFDCQHLAALIYYLHDNFDKTLVEFSKETNVDEADHLNEKEKEQLKETFKQAKGKQQKIEGQKYQQELLEEYNITSKIFWSSPFFLPEEHLVESKAELALLFFLATPQPAGRGNNIEFQLMLRLPNRSKPLNIPNMRDFLEPIRYHEPSYIGERRYFFSSRSFDHIGGEILHVLIDHVRYHSPNTKNIKTALLSNEAFGTILAKAHNYAVEYSQSSPRNSASRFLPCLFHENLETPINFSPSPIGLHFDLQFFQTPAPKILLKPMIALNGQTKISPEEAVLFKCSRPGIIYNNVYYPFHEHIKRMHLQSLNIVRDMTIPEPLFGSFVENALPELQRFATVSNKKSLKKFVTIPFVDPIEARCDINYLNNELEAHLYFVYDEQEIPDAPSKLRYENINTFVTDDGILARNFAEERAIINDLFEDFIFNPKEGAHITKSEKKIVEFMTETIPQNQHRVEFHCPENLLEQFIYNDTSFTLAFDRSEHIDSYTLDLQIDGDLDGVKLEQLWECLYAKKPYIELNRGKKRSAKSSKREPYTAPKILVLDLDELAPIIELFDELEVKKLFNHTVKLPLWSLATLDPKYLSTLPIDFTISDDLLKIREQILGNKHLATSKIPSFLNKTLRKYQKEGTQWLDRLRSMHLNGILADDMGLGKTVQAITALTQDKSKNANAVSLVVCPTSLTYNWKEEFAKFNPNLNVAVIDGVPESRKKILNKASQHDILITSYGLLQKDIELYKKRHFSYVILDEGQHIKNPDTRNAKSVKMLNAKHRLILTGTPIENSLEELWSLFDFLMPGLLGTFSRFNEKYLRTQSTPTESGMSRIDLLRNKVSPFIMRRMKKDVLSDLPPVSEIVYHCQLTDTQKALYKAFASSAREELCRLVDKEGFDKIQIHVLATLTRLKQICCHPAIFAKEKVESNDSAKYEMLFELLASLIEGGHKTVLFSQYTRMLNIIKGDLKKLGIPFSYLDGSTKNRLDVVNEFNDNEKIPIFLVSLKAGGSGLNLVGADTVIHYDMWWNPAVENQATDRVHRIGQKNAVSSYKLVTLGTIEEKILQLQNSKRKLVDQVISSDDDVIVKLTWEEVLDLLQT